MQVRYQAALRPENLENDTSFLNLFQQFEDFFQFVQHVLDDFGLLDDRLAYASVDNSRRAPPMV